MSRRLLVLALGWSVVDVVLSVAGFAGGDASIVSGLLWLLWTAPLGLIWQFYLYDFALVWMPARVATPLGIVTVDILALLFWFFAVSRLHAALSKTRARKSRPPSFADHP
jgi:hypothetical protein